MPRDIASDAVADYGQGPFVGRKSALATMRDAWKQVQTGGPRMVLVEGTAGIGKSALARQFLAHAGAQAPLIASGDEAEIGLAFGVLAELIGSIVTDSPVANAIRERTRREDVAAIDPLTAGAALVDILGQVQQSGAAVLFVDDIHWADRPSLQALTFALRRLHADRVLTVFIARDAADTRLPDGLRRLLVRDDTVRLHLDGLDTDELRELSGELRPQRLSRPGARRLHIHTGGNPLHARTLLEQLPATAFDDPGVPLPAPRSFAMLVLARLAGCGTDAEALVTGASVLGTHCRLDMAARLADLKDPLPALGQAADSGLLVERPGDPQVRFPHPLVHAAVYQQIGPGRRSALHRRAAGLADEELQRLRHLASAAIDPDGRLADEIADLARRLSAVGGWASAADQFGAAARVTPDDDSRERYLLEMAECLLMSRDVPDQAELTAQVRAFRPSVWRSHVLGRLAFAAGELTAAEALLSDAWTRGDPDADPEVGSRIAGELATVHAANLNGRETVAWADVALRLAAGQNTLSMIRYVRLVGYGLRGDAREALDSLGDLPDPAVASVAQLETVLGRGELRMFNDDLPGALRDLSGVLAVAFSRSAIFSTVAAGALSMAEYRAGRWDDAAAHCELALSLAADGGQEHLSMYCRMVAALIAAGRGDWRTAEAQASVVRAAASGGHWSLTVQSALAQASIARARGQPSAVIAALDVLLQPDRPSVVDEPGLTQWRHLLAEALVATGKVDRAESALEPYETRAAVRGLASAMTGAGRARAVLHAARGNQALAEESFQTALDHARHVDVPFDRALLHLAYGRFLRRGGRRTRASEHLSAARDLLAGLGARPDLERCERELAACGVASGASRSRGAALLTPQEVAVARLAAGGLSNPQVAQQLIISVKTVEYHLGHVYAKLQIPSRAYLAEQLARD